MKEFCVDFELAKELKENGYDIPSEYAYFNFEGDVLLPYEPNKKFKDSFIAYAPFSDEILKELPPCILIDTNLVYLKIDIHAYFYSAGYMYENHDETLPQFIGMNFHSAKLSNVFAKIYIYLKKEGFIK